MFRVARISRKNIKQSNITLKYNVGIYARLSIEDNVTGGDSIENQVAMLKNYIEKNEQLIYKKTYIDNGFSGTNFDRDAFNKLIEDVKKGIINTIVVKDLSRFGRNYIESGHYIEKIFPNIGVRFIAVTDNFDSLNIKDNQDLEIALKSIINDSYAKDISKKICTALDAKKKNGKFLGKYAPYGYKKSAENKYVLEVNEETKDVVTMIFNLRIKGMGVTAIAHKLNNLNIPSQYRYLWEKGLRGSKDVEEKALWRGSSVKSLLENPNYIGAIMGRQYDTALYKGRQNNKRKLEHVNIIKNTHEPIIDKEIFYKVQSMSKGNGKEKATKNKDNILKGMIVCGTCGGKLQRDSGYRKVREKEKAYTFYCPKKYIKDDGCNFNGIKEDKLKDIIFKNLQLQINILLDEKNYKETYLNSPQYKRELSHLESKRSKLIGEKNKIKMLKEDTYKDYKAGLLSASGYEFVTKKYEKEYSLLLQQIDQLNVDKSSLLETLKNPAVNNTISFKDEIKLTREMLVSLIHSITVIENKIVIKYKFKDEYKAFLGV
ncbi:recombinase family protein [Anaeromicrobium sp.]|uniref:recombinase family protein n=1 Tax=Anaeromicrobium sp. TaxID=1929132 RepID=UPI0025FC37C1|nr:recombinase family protein [Anaeromicrobium sp.]